jgi:hypothetical protein
VDRTSFALGALTVAVFSAAASVSAAAAFAWNEEDLLLLGALAMLVIVSEALDFGAFKSSRISVSVALIFAGGVFAGLPGAAAIAAITAVTDALIHPRPVIKSVFNIGTLILTAGLFCGVLQAFSGLHGSTDYVAMIGPAMLAAACAFVVNSGLVTAAIALDNRLAAFAIWRENFAWMTPHYIFMGQISVVIALAYDRWEITGLMMSVIPLAMLWLAMKQYVGGPARSNTIRKGTAA